MVMKVVSMIAETMGELGSRYSKLNAGMKQAVRIGRSWHYSRVGHDVIHQGGEKEQLEVQLILEILWASEYAGDTSRGLNLGREDATSICCQRKKGRIR